MTIRKVTLLSLITLVVVLSATLLRAQSGGEQQDTEQMAAQNGMLDVLEAARRRRAEQLEGTWLVTVTPPVPTVAPFRVYDNFEHGGTFINSDLRRPLNQKHGVWKHLGGNEFANTGVIELYDTMGNLLRVSKTRQKITVTGPNSFVGVSNLEERNPAGDIVMQGCSTLRGERMTVEPLPELCQSITPPQ